MNYDLKREINRVKNLKQNEGKSNAFIEKQAKLNIWRRQIDIESKFHTNTDKEDAKKLFDEYLANYEFESLSDLNTLADLICEEILKKRLQSELAQTGEKDQLPNDKTISSLHSIEERVLKLKEILGLDTKKEQEELSALQELQKKFSIYIAHNRNEFSTVCGHCGQMLLLRRRCDDNNFETLKHPMFSGRFYYNRRGMELVKAGIWTKEQYAWVFYTSVDYVDWCLKEENKIVEIENIDEDEIKNFIDKKYYLKKPKEIPENILKENKDLGEK